MKLPLDNFQVLGVSPGSSASNILMILERRLTFCNYEGFSKETLRMRKDLLHQYSKPLLDTERRSEFEQSYKAFDPMDEDKQFIETPKGNEVAGLLLLLESGQYDECLTICNELLAGKQKKINTENDYISSDLYLVIAYGTIEYGKILRAQRHYEYSCRILERGLESIKGRIDQGEIERLITKELEDIVPYRILDLLSREMDEEIREKGMQLLDNFIMERGGLDNISDLYIKNDEFKAFFRQIRYFLTVQEQIDLYQKWCKSGCRSACFLLGISLVASGFARRKPERLIQALKVMNKLDSNELRDIIAYTSLLLGKVEVAKDISFYSEASNPDENKASPETRLAILCSNCREWLEHDVLEGYRDLETDTDLEAYFSDRDVTTFIEEQDSNIITDKSTNKTFLDPRDLSNKLLRRSATDNTNKSNKPTKNNKVTYSNKIRGVNHFIFLRFIDKKWTISILALTLLIIIWSFISRGDQTKQKDVTSIGAKRTLPVDMNEHVKGKEKREEISKRLTSKEQVPNKSELENILSEWLNIKTKTLSGLSISKNVSRIATPEAIKRLESERKGDIAKAERQRIIVAIRNLDIIRRERQRIEVKATLSYEDERLNKDGKIIEKTPKHVFKKTYILVNNGTGWLLQ